MKGVKEEQVKRSVIRIKFTIQVVKKIFVKVKKLKKNISI